MSELTRLLADLVAIDSRNPDLVPGAPGERACARYVAEWCEARGLAVEVVEVAPGRPNVYATARGRGGGRRLLLNAHTDVVDAGEMVDPFTPRIDGRRLYGRGSADMKSGLAAAMWATAEAARVGLAGDVVLTAVCDEEYASIGSQAVARDLRADAAIVTEPTDLDVQVAHKGFAWIDVVTRGEAAHGSRPDLGVDANAAMGAHLTAVAELSARLQATPGHRLLGAGSAHAALVSGGTGLSTYADRCLLQLERRTVPGEDAALIEAEARAAFAGAEVTVRLVREPFEIAEDAQIVRLVRESAHAETGREPAIVGSGGWMDSALLAAAGIPTVVYGPGGEGFHADVEWADLDQLEACARVLARVAERFCS